jgi:hypothetical protein
MFKDKLTNIPENSFLVMDTQSTSFHAIVARPDSGVFELTPFAYWQVIAGSQHFMYFSEELKGHGLGNVASLIGKISMYGIETLQGNIKDLKIDLFRGDVEIIQGLLEARKGSKERVIQS